MLRILDIISGNVATLHTGTRTTYAAHHRKYGVRTLMQVLLS